MSGLVCWLIRNFASPSLKSFCQTFICTPLQIMDVRSPPCFHARTGRIRLSKGIKIKCLQFSNFGVLLSHWTLASPLISSPLNDDISLVCIEKREFAATTASKFMFAYLLSLLFTILLNFGDGSHEEIYSIIGKNAYIELGQKRAYKWKYNWKTNWKWNWIM